MAILTLNKVDFKINSMNRDKESHFIMIKGPIYHEGITTINVYVPDNRDSKHESKVNKIKWRNKLTIIGRDITTLFSH